MSNTGPYASLPMYNSEIDGKIQKVSFPILESMNGKLCMQTGVVPHAVPIAEDAETCPSKELLLPKKR